MVRAEFFIRDIGTGYFKTITYILQEYIYCTMSGTFIEGFGRHEFKTKEHLKNFIKKYDVFIINNNQYIGSIK